MVHHDGASSISVKKDRFLSLYGVLSSSAVECRLHALGSHAICLSV